MCKNIVVYYAVGNEIVPDNFAEGDVELITAPDLSQPFLTVKWDNYHRVYNMNFVISYDWEEVKDAD